MNFPDWMKPKFGRGLSPPLSTAMSKLVCSLDSADCMIHRCEKCPGNDNLRNHLSTILNARDLDVFVV